MLEGEEVTGPGREGTGNGQPELSYTLTTMNATAETQGDPLSYGEEEARCASGARPRSSLGLTRPSHGPRPWGVRELFRVVLPGLWLSVAPNLMSEACPRGGAGHRSLCDPAPCPPQGGAWRWDAVGGLVGGRESSVAVAT